MRDASVREPAREQPGVWSLGPYLLLLAAGLLLAALWGAIPERFPVQWGATGRPSRYVARTPLGVFAPLLLGAAVCGLLRAIGKGLPRAGGRDEANRQATALALLATEYLIATVFSLVALATALTWPHAAWLVTATALAGTAALVTFLVVTTRRLARAQGDDPREARAWKWGLFYADRDDPALFVPKRLALGYTLNFGHPRAWLVVLALVVFVARILGVAASGLGT